MVQVFGFFLRIQVWGLGSRVFIMHMHLQQDWVMAKDHSIQLGSGIWWFEIMLELLIAQSFSFYVIQQTESHCD